MKRKQYLIAISLSSIFFGFLMTGAAFADNDDASVEPCPVQQAKRGIWYDPTRYQACMDDTLPHQIMGYDNDDIIDSVPDLENRCCTCSQRTVGDNDYAQGATWLNNYASNTVDPNNQSQVFQMYNSLATANIEEGIATAYVHGQVYSCGNNDNTATIARMNSKKIYILKGTSECEYHQGATSAQLEDCSLKVKTDGSGNWTGGYITNADYLANTAELGRINTSELVPRTDHLPLWTWSTPSQAVPVKFDVEKLQNTHGVTVSQRTRADGTTYTTYSDKVWIFRCPNIAISSGNGTTDGRCGVGNALATLAVEIEDTPSPKTCSEKYPDKTSVNRPSWWSGAPFEYNECGGTSVLASQVKAGNTSAVVNSESGSSEATLYVKPGATVEFDHFYLSASQKATNTEITVNGTTNAARYFINGNGNWRNGHYVTNSINGGDATGHGWTNNGGSNVGTVDHFNLTNYYDITKGPGGNSHSGANDEHGVLRTGSQVLQRNVGDVTNPRDITINENLDGVTSSQPSVTTVAVSAVVPYNYVNTAEAAIPNNNSRIYVGETARIDGTFRTKGKTNGRVVGGDSAYATVSPNTSYRLYTYYSDRSDGSDKNCLAGASGCELQFSESDIRTNSDESPDGSGSNVYWHASPSKTINIPDISLGTTGKYLCVTAAIYPANSGDDTSLNPNGNDQWDSQTKCAQLAKKPTFQIRGGNLYAAGSITVNTSTKNNLDNNSVTGTFAFGPWIEHGIIAGKTNEAASGAALGYTGNSNGVLRYDYNFGASASSTCKYQPITVANNNCYSGSSAGNAGNSGVRVAASDTVNLDDYMDTARTKGKHVGNSVDGVDLSDSSNYIEVNGVRYTYANSGLSIKATGSLPSGTTHVIFATGAVAIVGNLQYNSTNNGAGYTKASEIPQYIVISNSNINIGYSVTRVDAWLIAKNGTIDTCKEGSTIGDESECAKQLRINGPIVAKDLELDRAYGAATGAYSAVPAEVINVSPATYIFSQAKANENTSLRTVYSKEVAPRW